MWTITNEEANLVSRHRGTLPVILSCPHGGSRQTEDVPEERGETNPNPECRLIKKQSDLNTREITTRVAQRLLDTFGEAPYVVIAEFHRKYIDANREAACAYEVEPHGELCSPFATHSIADLNHYFTPNR